MSNPIEQAIEALLTGAAMCAEGTSMRKEIESALTSLRSLQKEVEGVEPVGWRHKQYGHIQWRSYDMTPEVCDRYTNSGQWDLLYTADQLRTAVAAALGRGAVSQRWTPTPENINTLPAPVRSYIHELVANADPAGTVRDLTIARDTVRALESSNRALRDLDTPGNRHPEFRFAGYAGEPLPEKYTPDQHAAYDEGIRARIAAPSPEAAHTTQAEAPSERKALLRRAVASLRFWRGQMRDDGVTPSEKLNSLISDLDAALASQQAVQAEPVKLDHIACIEDGELRYMTGRKAPAYDCELYAMPDGKSAPKLYTATPPAPGQVERDREDAERWCWYHEGDERVQVLDSEGEAHAEAQQWIDDNCEPGEEHEYLVAPMKSGRDLLPSAARIGESIFENISETLYDEMGAEEDPLVLTKEDITKLGELVRQFFRREGTVQWWTIDTKRETKHMGRAARSSEGGGNEHSR